MELKKTFLGGKMNKDLDQRLLSGGQYSDALNITIDTSEGSNIGSVSNSLGNGIVGDISSVLSGYVPAINTTNARTIGAIAYEPLNLIYWFVSSDEYDAIFEYNQIDNTTAQVLLSTKSGGNPSQLNFNQEYLITGVNYLPGHKDDGALLFWTDNLNPPRKINISRSKEYAVNDTRIDIDIDVILRPPLKSPVIYPVESEIIESNNMEERFLYFAYRYKYVDNEYSSMSPFSAVVFKPDTYNIDFLDGINKAMINKYNECKIVFETGNQFVKEIQLLAYDTRSLNVKIIKSVNKEDEGVSDNGVFNYTFSNNKIYAPLTNDQITRMFDNVPLLAKSQEIIGNRLVYGNYTQFRDITDANENDINVDFNVSYTSINTNVGTPISTFRTDRDYEVGIVYGDEYGRMTTALISDNNSVYIPSSESDKGNSIKVDINSNAPTWATNYRLVVKQAKQSYYNIFPIWFYSDGAYRYFRISEADRDKFKVGDYVIFKCDGTGPTFSNEKYKILEFELKESNFLGGEEVAALYFKIKVDDTAQFNEDNLPQFGSTSLGGNNIGGIIGNFAFPRFTREPIYGDFFIGLDKTIFYGKGDSNSLTVYPLSGDPGSAYISTSEPTQNIRTALNNDVRITVEIQTVNPTTYRWTPSLDLQFWEQQNIPTGTVTDVVLTNGGPSQDSGPQAYVRLDFDENGTYYEKDRWKINMRCNEENFPKAYPIFSSNAYPNATIFNVTPPHYMNANDSINNTPENEGLGAFYGGFAVVNGGAQANDSNGKEVDRKINQGDHITIRIKKDSQNPNAYTEPQEFFVPADYENIEEWFIESGAYKQYIQHDSNGNDIGAQGVCFRRGKFDEAAPGQNIYTGLDLGFWGSVSGLDDDEDYVERKNYPVRMFIPGLPTEFDEKNLIEVTFNLKQAGPISCETDPLENDVEVYHEVTDSYDIENGLHKVGWNYADFTDASTVFPGLTFLPANLTVLGPLDPTNPQPTDKPHNFTIGQQLYASGTSSIPSINPTTGLSYYSVAYVPNQYCVVIDFAFPGAASAEPAILYHQNWEGNQTASQPASIEINQTSAKNSSFNAYSFGNGVESYRIKDDFNAPEMKYSPRVTSIIEDYENERKEASLTYSGVFRGDTSINRLNEFNLSLANFKDLDREFGSIEKLYARDTDIFVFHQDKINKVLYGKNVLFDAVGGGQVASIPEVLGNEMPFPVEYGISNNPESFSTNAGDMYFTDSRRGAVIGIHRGSVNEISSLGMTDYFRDELKDNPNKQKLGGFDPYSNRYTLATQNTRRSNPCSLILRPTANTFANNTGGVSMFMFNIITSLSWSIALVDTGFGTSWVSPSATTGYGAQNIYANVANNFTGSTRTINFVVTYCTSQTQIFTLTQSVDKPISVDVVVVNKPEDRK